MASAKEKSVLGPHQAPSIPKGPWTKKLKEFPEAFCEGSIREYEKASGAKKHCISGYRMYKANKVGNVLLHYGSDDTVVKAKVEASFSVTKAYNAMCIVSKNGKAKSGHCTCAAGAGGVCKHVCALLWYLLDVQRMGHSFVPDSVACTSKPRAWGPGSSSGTKVPVKDFSRLSFSKHQPGKSPQQRPTSFDKGKVTMPVCALKQLCTSLEESGLSPMLREVIEDAAYTPVEKHVRVGESMELEERIALPACIVGGEACEFESCSLTLAEAHELEMMTRGQRNVPLWHEERKTRITASHFGDVVCRKAPVTEKFVASVFGGTQTRALTKYMKAGTRNESCAIDKYKALTKFQVYPVGLCVNPGAPFLGASPDGLVYDEETQDHGLVEVKTLAKAMEEGLSVQAAIEQRRVPFLKEGKLNVRHKYFYQIQGQLGITGIKWCDLVVDSGCDIHVERVEFDAVVWEDMLSILKQFYCKYCVPDENTYV